MVLYSIKNIEHVLHFKQSKAILTLISISFQHPV